MSDSTYRPPFDEDSRFQGYVRRLTDHLHTLILGLQTAFELRLKLFQHEMEEKVQTKLASVRQQVVLGVIMAVLAALGGVFLLVSLALFIGWALGHPAWGFLILGVVLCIGALVVMDRLKASLKPAPVHDVQALPEAPHNAAPALPSPSEVTSSR